MLHVIDTTVNLFCLLSQYYHFDDEYQTFCRLCDTCIKKIYKKPIMQQKNLEIQLSEQIDIQVTVESQLKRQQHADFARNESVSV